MNSFRHGLDKRNISTIAKRLYGSSSSGPGNKDPKSGGSKIPKSAVSTATHPAPVGLSHGEQRGKKLYPPLDTPLPGLTKQIYANEKSPPISFNTTITKLDTGYRIASQNRPGKYFTIGVAIGSGARYELGFPTGLSHIAEKLGFTSSHNYPGREKVLKLLEQYGGICDCQTSRDTTVYAISAETRGLEKIMHLLADVVLRPRITDQELSAAQLAAKYEWEDMQMRPEQETILLERVHAAAWGNSTLGLPRYCPPENIDNITRDHILSYMKTYFQPSRIVVSGVGVDHKELVDLTKMYFDNSKATWDTDSFKVTGPSEPDQSVAKYVGSCLTEEKDFGQFNSGPLPVPNLAHIAMGLESITHRDPDFIASCVLNIMMGGGGSFSAGGPGKGMYSRLYLNVLNQYHWIYNATAYNNSYGDSGLFCIYASAPPGNLKNLVNVLVREFAAMAGPIGEEEFNRSKTQLKSMLLMNLETRPIVFEDIGRQVLATNQYRTPEEYIGLIDKVKMEDIERLTRRLLASKPCIAAMGNLHRLPSLDEISADLADYTKRVIGAYNEIKKKQT